MSRARETAAGGKGLQSASPRTCTECGAPLRPRQRSACSPRCGQAIAARSRVGTGKPPSPKACVICGETWMRGAESRAQTCSPRCRMRWVQQRARERGSRIGRPPGTDAPTRPCSAQGCVNPVTRDVPICHEHMPRFETWRDPPARPRITAVTAWARPGSQDDAAQPLEDPQSEGEAWL